VAFDVVVNELAALLPFAFVGTVSPGPNNAILWTSGIRFGVRRTLPYVAGTALAMGALVATAAAGLAVLIDTVAGVETTLKILGSLYLAYIAVQVVRGGGVGRATVASAPSFWHGFAFQWLNPKAWLFVLVVAGTFVPPEMHRVVGVALAAAAIVGVASVSSSIWAVGGAALGRIAEDERRRRAFGVVLALLLAASVVLIWV
jgi:threonine/homoserine/homoserine lactone efflux protein